MKRRTQLILKLLKKSSGATLTLPKDFLNTEIMEASFTDDLKNALKELKQDNELTVTTERVNDNCIITITLKNETEEV